MGFGEYVQMVIPVLGIGFEIEENTIAKFAKRERRFAKTRVFGQVIYAGVAGIFMFNGITGYGWNPLTQKENRRIDVEQQEVEKEKINLLERELFGPNGRADFDGNGEISPVERARAYGMMGIEDKITFETPTSEELERFPVNR